jgi:hypothetical protein
MKPIEAPVPLALAAMGHRGVVYRDPYGVAHTSEKNAALKQWFEY